MVPKMKRYLPPTNEILAGIVLLALILFISWQIAHL